MKTRDLLIIAIILLLGIAWTLFKSKEHHDRIEAEKWERFMRIEHCVKLGGGMFRCDSGTYRGR